MNIFESIYNFFKVVYLYGVALYNMLAPRLFKYVIFIYTIYLLYLVFFTLLLIFRFIYTHTLHDINATLFIKLINLPNVIKALIKAIILK